MQARRLSLNSGHSMRERDHSVPTMTTAILQPSRLPAARNGQLASGIAGPAAGHRRPAHRRPPRRPARHSAKRRWPTCQRSRATTRRRHCAGARQHARRAGDHYPLDGDTAAATRTATSARCAPPAPRWRQPTPSSRASSTMRSARCARPATMRGRPSRWDFACSTMSPSPPAMRSRCTGWSGWPSSTSTSTTATAPPEAFRVRPARADGELLPAPVLSVHRRRREPSSIANHGQRAGRRPIATATWCASW